MINYSIRRNISDKRKDKIVANIVYANLIKKIKDSKEADNFYGIDILSIISELLKKKKIDIIQLEKAKNIVGLITNQKLFLYLR